MIYMENKWDIALNIYELSMLAFCKEDYDSAIKFSEESRVTEFFKRRDNKPAIVR